METYGAVGGITQECLILSPKETYDKFSELLVVLQTRKPATSTPPPLAVQDPDFLQPSLPTDYPYDLKFLNS